MSGTSRTPPLDPVALQVMAAALRAVAEEMEAALVRSAYSVNIKERRDCSTAVFDAGGHMVAQAAAVPVHLGAMPEAVEAVRRRARPGEVWMVNDPYRGGTHLPDITLISPVSVDGRVVAHAVSRAHHADVGGMAPGSMPAGSRELVQEGLVIPPVRLVAGGDLAEDVLALVLANSRAPGEREGDLRAQVAAHRLAERRLGEVAARHGGADGLEAAFAALLAYAGRRTRAAIAAIPDGVYRAEEALEGDGVSEEDLVIRVAVRVDGERMVVDFDGTVAAGPGNCNCPLAVTRSAVYFVVRCLTDPDIPASAGAFAPVEVRAPAGSLVNATAPAAVAGGNVETSSRIVDALFAALGQAVPVPAQGQGTMNNLTLGGAGFTYYETLGGGQGASPGADGPSAVHVAMSNTLNTPVEALEVAYPLRVEAYAVRRGSGGAGRHRGGDGVVRRIRVLAPAEASVIAERRRRGPRGAEGGADGAPGRTLLNGEPLPAKWRGRLAAGDVIELQTPGGGGHGRPGP